MDLECTSCELLWPDELFAEVLSGNVPYVCSPITDGCAIRLISYLNRNRHAAGVEAGTSQGMTADINDTFHDVIRRVASETECEKQQLKCKMPLMKNVNRSVKVALTKDSRNCCMKAEIFYLSLPKTDVERKRTSRLKSVLYEAEKLDAAGRESRRSDITT
jgi:hypothetical protein